MKKQMARKDAELEAEEKEEAVLEAMDSGEGEG
jgi:hypothetical protein